MKFAGNAYISKENAYISKENAYINKENAYISKENAAKSCLSRVCWIVFS